MKPKLPSEHPDLNKELRAIMGLFAAEPEAHRIDLAFAMADDDLLLLEPVCDVDMEKGDFTFTTVLNAKAGPILNVFTNAKELPTTIKGPGHEVFGFPFTTFIWEVKALGFIALVIDPDASHSVTLYYEGEGFHAYSTQKIREAAEE